MQQTFELYLEDESGERRFETLLCRSVADVLPRVRAMIAERNLAAVEVRVADQHLFTIAR
jgi:hypothetical protein